MRRMFEAKLDIVKVPFTNCQYDIDFNIIKQDIKVGCGTYKVFEYCELCSSEVPEITFIGSKVLIYVAGERQWSRVFRRDIDSPRAKILRDSILELRKAGAVIKLLSGAVKLLGIPAINRCECKRIVTPFKEEHIYIGQCPICGKGE